MVKSKNKIVDTKVNGNSTTYTLEEDSYLSDSFDLLPQGIIDKTETGIGGTSLELDANRNSIIVQPYVNTAKSKAEELSRVNKFKVHFYSNNESGSSKKSHLLRTQNEVLDYIKNCKVSGKPVKITCVTDQLKNLKEILGESDFQSYHLVLDEIDAIQEQSNFRETMQDCMDIYLEHPEQKRTVISATVKEFSEPRLKHENLTKFDRTNRVKGTLNMIKSKHLVEETVIQILHKIKTNPTEKIVIACNHLQSILDIVNDLKKQLPIGMSEDDIKILCSSQNIKKAGKHFSSMTKGGLLPGKINFITAAYFNGFDINESYHNIIVVENKIPSLRLSHDTIYQISGRCRKKLLSNTFIYKMSKVVKKKLFSKEDLIKGSNEANKIAKFIEEMKNSSNEYTQEGARAFQRIYLNGTKEFPSVVINDGTGQFKTSYLKVDKVLLEQETYEIYESTAKLYNKLSQRYNLSHQNPLFKSPKDKIKEDAINPSLIAESLVKEISDILKGTGDPIDKIEQIKKNSTIKNGYEKLICDTFIFAQRDKSIDVRKLSEIILRTSSKRTYLQVTKTLYTAIQFKYYSKDNSHIVNALNIHFKSGEVYSNEDIEKRRKAFIESVRNQQITTKSTDLSNILGLVEKTPKLVTTALVQIKDSKTNGVRKKKIISHEPFDLYLKSNHKGTSE